MTQKTTTSAIAWVRGHLVPFRAFVFMAVLLVSVVPAVADDLLYRYEGDVLPYDDSAGWDIFNACEDECSEALIDGHYILHWTHAADLVNYNYDIARPPDAPPKSLWVEWRFRSNHPKPPHSYTCDAQFSLHYGSMAEVVFMYGDAAISFSGDHGVLGLDIDEFHTYRFESLDGQSGNDPRESATSPRRPR